MQWHNVLDVAKDLARQASGNPEGREWSPKDWENATKTFFEFLEVEDSLLRLGDVLRCDSELDLPPMAVKATYEKLFELGVSDVRSRVCYARYLLLYGPSWGHQANQILSEVEETARLAGIWDGPLLGHHPVFYSSE